MLTADLIRIIFPNCKTPDAWAAALPPAMARFEINSKARLASFLAQVGYESGQFNRLVEGMIYSTPGRLMAVWPKRFPTESSAMPFVRNDVRLGNFVYANRMGNGDVNSGDGFRYRGRGLIQLTGRSNYLAASAALGMDLVAQPELLQQPVQAALSAGWFWQNHGLNALADDRTGDSDLEDFKEITRRINGGTVGLNDRLALFNQIQAVLP